MSAPVIAASALIRELHYQIDFALQLAREDAAFQLRSGMIPTFTSDARQLGRVATCASMAASLLGDAAEFDEITLRAMAARNEIRFLHGKYQLDVLLRTRGAAA